MPAIMCCVPDSVDDLHDCTPDDAIVAIVIWVPIGITQKSSPRRIHPGNYQWKNSGMDGNNPDAGNGFALGDPDETLPDVDVCLMEMEQFSDSHTRVEQYQHSVNVGRINVLP